MIIEIDFDTIFKVWSDELWKERASPIESNSAMCFLGGYDIENMRTKPTFLAYSIDGKIAGVNSGHYCKNDNSYRSRGLFVFENYRGRGIGTKLLIATVEKGVKENAKFVWSYPRLSSWKTYQNAGFNLVTDWAKSELGDNAYCARAI
jgi:GNAT superfamily N-acetyltransferase